MNKYTVFALFALSFLVLMSIASEGHAQTTVNTGFLNDITKLFNTNAANWSAAILAAAKRLFWSLALISLIFSFGYMAVEGSSDFGKIYSTLLRFMIVIGLFWWFLEEGPKLAQALINSFSKLAGKAHGSSTSSPSAIINLGLSLFSKLAASADRMSIVSGIVANLIAVGVLIILCLIAANVTIEWCATYVLVYAGMIVLGFGSLAFTRDFAIAYLKALLAQGLKLMTMILVAGLAADFVTTLGGSASKVANIGDCAIMLVASLVILLIMNKVPNMLAGLISSTPTISTLGIGTAIAVTGTALGAAATLGTGNAAIGQAAKEGFDKLAKATASAAGAGDEVSGSGSLTPGGDSGKGGGATAGGSTSGDKGGMGKAAGLFSRAMGFGVSGMTAVANTAKKAQGMAEKAGETVQKAMGEK